MGGQVAHFVGDMGKFAKTPCVSCDFKRRRDKLGLSVALQMWLKSVKRDRPIVLSIRKANKSDLDHDDGTAQEASQRLVTINGSSSSKRRLPDGLDASTSVT